MQNFNDEINKVSRELADSVFTQYHQAILPQELFAQIGSNQTYSMLGQKLIDRGVLISTKTHTILYECGLNLPSEEDSHDYGIEECYTNSYLFIDEATGTVSSISGLFDVWDYLGPETLEEILLNSRRTYLDRIKIDIENKLEMYLSNPYPQFNLKKSLIRTIYSQLTIIKTLFPDIYAKIPQEILDLDV